jgi:hypothetical protein
LSEGKKMANVAHDYSEFDKKLLSCIEAGTQTAMRLSIALEADAKPMVGRPGEECRVIDRRLQALRKKGVIAWERRGREVVWSLTK